MGAMGKLEKGVVLGVLFLISVIMVLSINTGTPDAGELGHEPLENRVAQLPVDRSPETSTPLERQDRHAVGVQPQVDEQSELAQPEYVDNLAPLAPSSEDLANPSPDNVGLLNSSVGESDALPDRLVGGLRIESDWDLKSVAGLERSLNPAFLIHSCARGETYEGLARKLYGDVAKAELLRRNNEGLKRLEAGLEILIPVSDDRGPDAGNYVVQDGESLWVISKRFYGKGSRWGEIFEANREVLTSPESVRKGMTLRIP
ncbi:MAG: nucleoid-associated protein YgaU [Chlamydiales bacterium]|jgi:nucleoid-associated protein YgaU